MIIISWHSFGHWFGCSSHTSGRRCGLPLLCAHMPEHLDGGAVTMSAQSSVALYIWHRRIIELTVFGMTGGGSAEPWVQPHPARCAQRLEVPEDSPARRLDAAPHAHTGIEPAARALYLPGWFRRGDHFHGRGEWWWVGPGHTDGRVGWGRCALPVYLPPAARGLPSAPSSFKSNPIT